MQDVLSKPAGQLHPQCCRLAGKRQPSIYVSAAWIAFLLLAIANLAGCGITYNTVPLTVNPSSISFGTVNVGQTQSASITLQNPGLAPVALSGMQVADPAFQLSPAQMATVPAGGSVAVKIVFAPTAAKSYSSEIVVTSGNQKSSISVAGTGQQSVSQGSSGTPALQLSATALQFGSVPIGTDAQQSLTLTSSGTAPLQVSALSAQGTAFSAQTPSLPVTLQPGQALTVPVKFGPKASGQETGRLVIASNAAQAPSVTVNLVGNGEPSSPPPPTSGTPALTLSSTAVNFGSVAVGSQGSNSVALTSSGTAAVVLQSLSVSGDEFSAGQLHLPLTLAPGQQISLPLSFAPSSAGAQQGLVTLADNATGSPSTINLSGNGTTTASLSVPGDLDFGDVTVGSEGNKTITLVSSGTGDRKSVV